MGGSLSTVGKATHVSRCDERAPANNGISGPPPMRRVLTTEEKMWEKVCSSTSVVGSMNLFVDVFKIVKSIYFVSYIWTDLPHARRIGQERAFGPNGLYGNCLLFSVRNQIISKPRSPEGTKDDASSRWSAICHPRNVCILHGTRQHQL